MGRIVLGLAVSDFIDSSFKLIGRWGPDSGVEGALCLTQAVGIQEGTLSSLLFSLSMCLIILRAILGQSAVVMTRAKEFTVIALCFIVPIPLSLIPAFIKPNGVSLIGDSDQWCWIKGGKSNLVYQIVFFYGIFWFGKLCLLYVVFLFNVFSLLYTYFSLSGLCAKIDDPSMKKKTLYVVKRMVAFLTAFLFAWTASNINRMTTFALGSPVYELAALQAWFSPSRGFYNFLAFMYCYYTSPARTLQSSFGASQTKSLMI